MSTTMQRLSGSISAPSVLTGRLGIAFLAAPTGDATAAVTDILAPKTAYIATGKVTGTCTFDADTSDATATESDILLGETAYARGVKLTGTLYQWETDYVKFIERKFGLFPDDLITEIGPSAFGGAVNDFSVSFPNCIILRGSGLRTSKLTSASLPALTTLVDGYCFSGSSMTSISLPSLTTLGLDRIFSGCTMLQTASFPKVTSIVAAQTRFMENCTALTEVQFGSIGYPVTAIYSFTLLGCTQLGLTITVYVTPSAQPLASSPWGATNATIVYRSAVDGSVL